MWEGKGVGELCVDSKFCKGDLINFGKGGEWWNCVLTAYCFRGLDKGWEGKGVENCVLRADFVRGIV